MNMKTRYLEVTFRKGKLLAAYLYLPRKTGDVSSRTEPYEAGLLIDYAVDGRPIGIEITAPNKVTLTVVNKLLKTLNQEPASAEELGPLIAA